MRMQVLYPLTLLILLCACVPADTPPEKVSSDTYFPMSLDGTQLELQLALTESERNRGLMYRDRLPEDHGMLFLYKTPGTRSFWMRNTKIPLDLAYFDSQGVLLEIRPLYPYNENPVVSYSKEVLIAIEMNQGWFSQKNITPGTRLDLDALKAAISKRGFPVDEYPF